MTLYSAVLLLHSWLRGAVLALCLVLVARTALGWLRSRPWARVDERLQVTLTALMDVQLLLGVALYAGLSPLVHAFFADAAAGMRAPAVRFFGVEHVAAMLLVLLLVVAAIPWPPLGYGRPLFRTADLAHGALQALLLREPAALDR